jgi:hypothetical protein
MSRGFMIDQFQMEGFDFLMLNLHHVDDKKEVTDFMLLSTYDLVDVLLK